MHAVASGGESLWIAAGGGLYRMRDGTVYVSRPIMGAQGLARDAVRTSVGPRALCQGDGVAFYGSVYPADLKEKDPEAKKFIEALERAGDCLSIGISGANNHYHHWNQSSIGANRSWPFSLHLESPSKQQSIVC